MSAVAILAIVVATGEARDPATAIMLKAAAESLLSAEISVRLIDARDPGEIDPVRVERDTGAGAVITLVWIDPARLRARIRLHVAAGGRSTTRELVFSPADTRTERGRTLGLAAASMWPETLAARRGQPPDRKPADVATVAEPPARPPPAGKTDPTTDTRTDPTATSPELARPAQAERPLLPPVRPAAGISIIGATGIGGPAGGLGARLEGVLPIASNWSLRAGLSLRMGSFPVLGGSDLVGALAGGVEWWPPSLRFGRRGRVGMRADALALRHEVTGSVTAGPAESRGRFLPGLDLLAQVGLNLGARFQLLLAVGSEAALGATEIRAGRTPVTVATIPALRLTAEMGGRLTF